MTTRGAGAPLDADVLVVGAGPAARAAARACARMALDVVLVAPDPAAPWHQTYGAWEDDWLALAGLGVYEADALRAAVRTRWARPVLRGLVAREVDRAYVAIDNGALARALAHPGVEVRAGRAIGSRVAQAGGAVTLAVEPAPGATPVELHARAIVDASGARSLLSTHRWGGRRAVQSAWGVVVPESAAPDHAGRCTFMDWTPAPGAHDDADPTFLYALGFSDGTVLLEETSLVRTAPLDAALLRDRLERRVGAEVVARAVATERVVIPMGETLPLSEGAAVAFGAAASYAHPVTGYSVAVSLAAAPRVARALARGMVDGAAGPRLARLGRRAAWPRAARRARRLHRYGMGILLALRGREAAAFFDALAGMPARSWAPLMATWVPARRVAGAMARMSLSAPWAVRRMLVPRRPRHAVGGAPPPPSPPR